MEPSEELSEVLREDEREDAMRKFLRRHWKMALLMIGWIAAASIVAVFVFHRVVADAQTIGLVPTTLGQWSVGIFFIFILTLILWELVFVVSWLIPTGAVIVFVWYRKLPEEERKEYGMSPKRGADPRRTEGGGFFSFLVGVVWLIIVWTTGRWTLAFQAWPLNDWIFSWIAACLWVLLPLGVAGAIFFIWWVRKDTKEES